MTDMYEEKRAAIAALLARHAVTYEAAFVPQSLSRNSASPHRSLNWRVALKRGAESFAFDYSQGIGHVPGWREPRTLYDEQCAGCPWETGKYNSSYRKDAPERAQYWNTGTRALPAPCVADILCSLLADDPQGECFEDWATISAMTRIAERRKKFTTHA